MERYRTVQVRAKQETATKLARTIVEMSRKNNRASNSKPDSEMGKRYEKMATDLHVSLPMLRATLQRLKGDSFGLPTRGREGYLGLLQNQSAIDAAVKGLTDTPVMREYDKHDSRCRDDGGHCAARDFMYLGGDPELAKQLPGLLCDPANTGRKYCPSGGVREDPVGDFVIGTIVSLGVGAISNSIVRGTSAAVFSGADDAIAAGLGTKVASGTLDDVLGAAAKTVNPWTKGWSARGLLIEDALGGNLPKSFPTIDRFENGVATSIKSIDLGAKTYQSPSALTSKLAGYVDKAAGFNGANFNNVNIKPTDVIGRGLDIAIPPGPVPAAQQAVLDQIVAYGTRSGVTVRVVPVG